MEMDKTLCLELMDTEFNAYFSCKQLVDIYLAKVHNVSLGYIIGCKKRWTSGDPYRDDRRSLNHSILHLLKKLETENKIKKWSQTFWKKVK